MARPVKYLTEEERQAARKETRKAYKKRYKETHADKFKAQRKREKKAHYERKREARIESNLSIPTVSGWEPCFVGVDGESFLTGQTLYAYKRDGKILVIREYQGEKGLVSQTPMQAYSLLKRSDLDKPLYDPEGLSTYQCLQYLTKYSPKRMEGQKPALVGFFLNFDTEWILKDLTERQYMTLREGEEIEFKTLFRLKWIANKRLEIYKPNRSKEGEWYRAAVLQDTQGFFQSSFVSALKKWNLPVPEIITDGKAARGDFEHADWKHWSQYNDAELVSIEALMMELFTSFKSAYEKIGLSFKATSDSWSGPGWWANDFLKQTRWQDEHPEVSDVVTEQFWKINKNFLPKADKDEVTEFAKYLRETDMLKQQYAIVDMVNESGGIRIDKKSRYYTEFRESVPANVRRRVVSQAGMGLDEVAEILNISVNELIESLADAKPGDKPNLQPYLKQAREILGPRNPKDNRNYPYPFACAYFGGRIELGAIGRFNETIYNYDINSAYPYALSLLPAWSPESFKYVVFNEKTRAQFNQERPMGMVQVSFNFPGDWQWYPFPVRVKGNVFYPHIGETWIMTAEYFAMLDTIPEAERTKVNVLQGLLLDDSEGYGDATKRMPTEKLCTTSRKVLEMAALRLREKKNKGPAEKALKLILNSLYGKTIQQVGKHKNFNDFAAAWITSVCRALLWRAVANERRGENLLMSMTDGIYARAPLPYCEERLSEILGQFEKETFSYFETFKPGVYRYADEKGMHYKVRGYLTRSDEERETLFALALKAMTTGKPEQFPTRNFIPRVLAREGWKREPYRYQFEESDKEVKSDLNAKRYGPRFIIPEGREYAFYPPKFEAEHGYMLNTSESYRLKFKEAVGDPLEDMEDHDMHEWLEKTDAYYGLDEYAE